MEANALFRSTPATLRLMIFAGLLVGTLDIAAAFISFYLTTGRNPLILLKAIASALLGPSALTGGGGMLLLGLALHFLIAGSFTVLFFWAYPRLALAGKSRVLIGVAYGLFIWMVMTMLVLPLSRLPAQPFSLSAAAREVGILVAMIGLPLAFLAARHFGAQRQE